MNYFYEDISQTISASGVSEASLSLGEIPSSRFPIVSASAIHNFANFNVFVDNISFTAGSWVVKIRNSSGDFPVGTVIHLRAFARC